MANNSPSPIPPTPSIRDIILLGHGGTGKTTLAEALLSEAGITRGGGRGGGGGASGGILDHEPEERDRGHSLSLGVASVSWPFPSTSAPGGGGTYSVHKLNLLDGPGGPDSVGDCYPALAAADVAVFVVDATVGVQAQHDQLWAACEQVGLPRVVFLNKLDKERAAYQANIDALRERYGKALAPVHMPIGVEREFTGIIDLLHFNAVTRRDGERVLIDVPDERVEQAQRNREFLVEAIVENDDELLERYLEGEIPDASELGKVFAHGIATCGFFPVLCGSAAIPLGVKLLAEFLIEECPAPQTDPEAPTALYVAKTLSDPYVGRINVLRVLSGRLQADDNLILARTGAGVRLRQLFTVCGREQTPVEAAEAGDLVAVAKLDDVTTGDVLAAKGAAAAEVHAPPPPEPYHRVALQPASSGDEDKLSTALSRLGEEDPSLRVERDPETHQLVLRTLGPGHVDVTLARMERKFGVSVRRLPLRIAYRETLRGGGRGLGRHVKQSGGHGQYGVARVEVEPLPRGSGFQFENRIVGGVIPHTYIPSVEKGVREAMTEGVFAGYPVTDVAVRLVDGKTHSVDSSDMAFQMAGILAFRAAAQDAGSALLEPVAEVAVTVPDDLTGDVMGDLSARRGRIQGSEPTGRGRTTVLALVPEAELQSYVAELRSLSRGTGSVTMRYDHHADVPDNVAKKVAAAAQEGD